MQEFERDFEVFCKSPSVDSGKARLYAKTICYLCDYMGIYKMDAESIDRIKSVEVYIKDKNSLFYKNVIRLFEGT